jgi:adenylate cyclase class 2
MSFEVEMKFRTPGHDGLVERLLALGAEADGEVEQEDAYYAHPARDFARTNEALRLRRVGVSNRITYKGPKLAGPTKTREEIEISFEDGDPAFAQMQRLFETLGFRPIALIRKSRRLFYLDHSGQPLEISLDRADSLGEFVEIEAIAGTDADLVAAQDSVQALARDLGLTELEPRSYLRMLLEQRGAAGD